MIDDLGGLVRRLDFCAQLDIAPRTAHNWMKSGYGPQPRRIGNRLYYVQAEIAEFLKEIRDGSPVVA